MRVPTLAGDLARRWVAERRARRISDPVEKLRYLRAAMGPRAGSPLTSGLPTRRRLLLLAALLAPLPTISDVPWPVSLEDPLPPPPPVPSEDPVRVWLVESNQEFEVYSNGLRIENRFAVESVARRYAVYDRETLLRVEWRNEPTGIVYHTTESHLAPFEPSQAERLRRVGEWLLDYVRRNRSYHFVIDRFGRVHRVVGEGGPANHAGYSVWADSRFVYVNLNPGFLGVAIETQTRNPPGSDAVNAAQIHAARILTDALRTRYAILRENCVTHAQVSVFHTAMLLGNHADWAAGFPYAELALSDNYSIPVPALAVFGFRYRPDFLKVCGEPLWRGVVLGEVEFRQRAAAAGRTEAQYRAALRRRYQEILKEIDEASASQEEQL